MCTSDHVCSLGRNNRHKWNYLGTYIVQQVVQTTAWVQMGLQCTLLCCCGGTNETSHLARKVRAVSRQQIFRSIFFVSTRAHVVSFRASLEVNSKWKTDRRSTRLIALYILRRKRNGSLERFSATFCTQRVCIYTVKQMHIKKKSQFCHLWRRVLLNL